MPKRVTRTATLDDLRDLLDRPPRAYLAFIDHGEITAAPVALRLTHGRYFVAPVHGPAGTTPRPGERAMLLVDDGQYTLELRGIRVRGHVGENHEWDTPGATDEGWLELIPEKVICWDYGSMRRTASE